MSQAERKGGNFYKYQLGTIGKMCVCASKRRNSGNYSGNADGFGCADYCFVWYLYFLAVRYYYHLMIPLKVFTEGISNMEEEQFLHEDGRNNILELEAVSDKFRLLLRKIQSLKIAIYEKELQEKRAELEYMQSRSVLIFS